MKLKQFLILSVTILFIASCKPSETTSTPTPPVPSPTEITNKNDLSALIGPTWKLVGMAFYEKDEYIMRPEKETGLTISFKEGGKFNYTLTVNKCTGTYSAEAESMKINELGACTKMCCDSEFARTFQAVLPRVKLYYNNFNQCLSNNGYETKRELEKVGQ